jgi:hypothetical protein
MDCADPNCGGVIPLGVWCFYNSDTKEAICLECSSKRGWTSKQRAKQLLLVLELKQDIKILKAEAKVRADGVHMLEQQINLYRLGENDLALEKQIIQLMDLTKEYLTKIATPKEKELFDKLFTTIEETKEFQKEIRDNIESRLYWFENPVKRKKKRPEIVEEESVNAS